ncbi:hypothetical protein ACIQZI_02920 [Peribacillus sp. NPDC096379]|uniref:hypothetical protein n=1 Tax=Peribacillus sp. NPDC096379 TaxID=3364393 RepID=UPI00382C5294
MNQKKKFTTLFGPTFLATLILLLLPDYRQWAIIPVLLFWLVFFVWESIDKKKAKNTN